MGEPPPSLLAQTSTNHDLRDDGGKQLALLAIHRLVDHISHLLRDKLLHLHLHVLKRFEACLMPSLCSHFM